MEDAMSVMYCEWCDRHIDTDWDVEHFDEQGQCVMELEECETTTPQTQCNGGSNGPNN
jgi:hypothetical protein